MSPEIKLAECLEETSVSVDIQRRTEQHDLTKSARVKCGTADMAAQKSSLTKGICSANGSDGDMKRHGA